MKIWCTKWALTQGILEVEAEECGPDFPGMVEVKPVGDGDANYYLHGEGRDWHRTEYDACVRVNVMADKKIAALKKQIRKIEMDQAGIRNRRDRLLRQA